MNLRLPAPAPPALAEANFRALVEQISAIVWVADLEGRTTYVSPQVEQILGTPVQTWIDDPRAWERQIHPDDRERVLATMAAAQNGEIQYRCEYRCSPWTAAWCGCSTGPRSCAIPAAARSPCRASRSTSPSASRPRSRAPPARSPRSTGSPRSSGPAAPSTRSTGDTLSPATAEFLERSGAPSLRKPFTSGDIRLALARVHDGAPRAEVAPQA